MTAQWVLWAMFAAADGGVAPARPGTLPPPLPPPTSASSIRAEPAPAPPFTPADPADDPLSELSAEDRARLFAGEVVVADDRAKNADGESVGRARGWVLVKTPWERCWEIMTDYPRQPEFMPRLKKTRVWGRNEREAFVEHTVKVAFTTVVYTLHQRFDRPRRTVRFQIDRTQENDIRESIGFWRFTPAPGPGGGTIIDFAVFLDAGFFIPEFIQRWLTKRDLPNLMQHARNRVDSGGTWKKDE